LFNNDQGIFSDHAVKAGINHASRDLSAIFADYDNDGYLDLFITNTQGNRLYKNSGEGTFKPVINTGINTKDNSTAAVFVDLDLEGDLDLFLATDSRNRLYRNNSDGTFIETGKIQASATRAFQAERLFTQILMMMGMSICLY